MLCNYAFYTEGQQFDITVENLVILVIQETFENSDKTKTYQNVLKNGVFPFHFWTCFVLVRSFDTALCRKLSRIV